MRWYEEALVRIFSNTALMFLFQLIVWGLASLMMVMEKLSKFNFTAYLESLPIVVIHAGLMTLLIRLAFKIHTKNIDINHRGE